MIGGHPTPTSRWCIPLLSGTNKVRPYPDAEIDAYFTRVQQKHCGWVFFDQFIEEQTIEQNRLMSSVHAICGKQLKRLLTVRTEWSRK